MTDRLGCCLVSGCIRIVSMKQLVVLLTLIAMMTPGFACADAQQAGQLSGRVMIGSDVPMAEALVYIYNLATGPAPSRDRFWRVPDHVARTGMDGRFATALPPGEFCLGAIKRSIGTTKIGPPLAGDHLLFSLDETGLPRKYHVDVGEKTDVGTISGALVFKSFPVTKNMTAIEGTVQDQEGKPIAGAMVFAFISPTLIGKPLFVSERSGQDGKFMLRVHQGGTYYLKVRDRFGGGAPVEGTIFDGGKEEPMQQVTVETGKVAGSVKLEVSTFLGRGRNKE